MSLVDVNAWFGHWPFIKFRLNTPAKLSRHLRDEGISLAVVSSAESVFSRDLDICNRLMIKKLQPYDNLIPLVIIDPSLPGWCDRLDECRGRGMPRAVKILPSYHCYELSDSRVDAFMEELRNRKMGVVIQMRIEDERSQYPLLKVPGVDGMQVMELAGRFPEVPVLCLCPYMAEAVALVQGGSNIYTDISFAERLNTVATLLEQIPVERVVFGSHCPFLYARAAIMKIRTADISKRDLAKIMSANACRCLGISLP